MPGTPRSRSTEPAAASERAASADSAGESDGLGKLLCAVAEGDMAAFEGLYDAVAPQVGGLIRRVLRDHAQAEEVTQEVLVEVWRNAPRFDPAQGTAATWIFTIAHRRAVDRVRASQAARDRDLRVGQSEHVVAYDDVTEQVENRLEAAEVRGCLDALSELQRRSLQLAYYEGHTYPEVARLLDVPLGTVKTRLRDGLIRMRVCLGAEV